MAWYTEQELRDYLRRNNYSDEIASELSEQYAKNLQAAFEKGQSVERNRIPEDTAPDKVQSPQARMMIRALFIDLLDRVIQHENGSCELIPEAYEDYSNDILVLCKLIDS